MSLWEQIIRCVYNQQESHLDIYLEASVSLMPAKKPNYTRLQVCKYKLWTDDAFWAVVTSVRAGRENHGSLSLWQGDKWLLLSWQIVLKAIEDVTTVIKEQLIDPTEVLQWIYHTHTERQTNRESGIKVEEAKSQAPSAHLLYINT